jgi:hypothetical protein
LPNDRRHLPVLKLPNHLSLSVVVEEHAAHPHAVEDSTGASFIDPIELTAAAEVLGIVDVVTRECFFEKVDDQGGFSRID